MELSTARVGHLRTVRRLLEGIQRLNRQTNLRYWHALSWQGQRIVGSATIVATKMAFRTSALTALAAFLHDTFCLDIRKTHKFVTVNNFVAGNIWIVLLATQTRICLHKRPEIAIRKHRMNETSEVRNPGITRLTR